MELHEKLRKEKAWAYYDLQSADRRGVLVLQAIRSVGTNYWVAEFGSVASAQSIIEDGISYILRYVEF